MSYDNPDRRFYYIGSLTLSGTTTNAIVGPKGKKGKLVDVHLGVSTTITGSPTVQVGLTGTLAAYGNFTPGVATAPAAISCLTVTPTGITGTASKGIIPADTQVLVTCAAAGAGVANVTVIIDWDS